MRPILLKGHERSITHITYNRDGDLLFSCSKANFPCLWYSTTGERIGTYNGHNGAVWGCDVDYDSRFLVTASADMSSKLWDVETGKELHHINYKSPARWVDFAEGGQQYIILQDQVMGQSSTIFINNVNEDGKVSNAGEIVIPGVKITQALWGPFGKTIITAGEDGALRVFDVATRKMLHEQKDHNKSVNRIAMDKHRLFFVTASRDSTARLYDAKNLKPLKLYETGRPCNAASMSSLKEHIILGGGQSAEAVTTSRMDSSQFKVRFFSKIFETELGSVPGHFGPVNTMSFSPDGRSFASGGEDGYVRVHHFDEGYLNSKNI